MSQFLAGLRELVPRLLLSPFAFEPTFCHCPQPQDPSLCSPRQVPLLCVFKDKQGLLAFEGMEVPPWALPWPLPAPSQGLWRAALTSLIWVSI